jgi:peptide/nickel transport system permease protein
MIRYIIGRIIALIPVVLIAAFIVFMVVHLIPGDPARMMLGEGATEEQVAQLREAWRLNDPLSVQFVTWLGNAARGDLGTSVFSDKPVLDIILGRIGPTFSLAFLSTALSIIVGVPFAMLAVWKRDSILDPCFMSVTLLGISIPNFWFSLILMLLFGVILKWLPISGYVPISDGSFIQWIKHLILPTIVLSAQQAGLIARMLRDGMLDVIAQDYIRTARSKGLIEKVIFMRHAFRDFLRGVLLYGVCHFYPPLCLLGPIDIYKQVASFRPG